MSAEMAQLSEAEFCRREIIRCQSSFIAGLGEVWSDTRACTAFLTEAIEFVARGFGAVVKREFALKVYRNSKRDGQPRKKQGHLDVLARFPDGSMLAVEIDTYRKSWSAKKLRFAKQSGMVELWVRWDGPRTRDRSIAVLNVEHPRRSWHPDEGRRSRNVGSVAIDVSEELPGHWLAR